MHKELATYPIGSRVRVSRGTIAGLVGEVVKLTESGKYAVKIEGFGSGVCLVINGNALTLIEATIPLRILAITRKSRAQELQTLKKTNPLGIITLYHHAINTLDLGQLPGVGFTSMIVAILAHEEANGTIRSERG